MKRTVVPLMVMCVATAFEGGSDALIRQGLRGAGPTLVVAGFIGLGAYGVVARRRR